MGVVHLFGRHHHWHASDRKQTLERYASCRPPNGGVRMVFFYYVLNTSHCSLPGIAAFIRAPPPPLPILSILLGGPSARSRRTPRDGSGVNGRTTCWEPAPRLTGHVGATMSTGRSLRLLPGPIRCRLSLVPCECASISLYFFARQRSRAGVHASHIFIEPLGMAGGSHDSHRHPNLCTTRRAGDSPYLGAGSRRARCGDVCSRARHRHRSMKHGPCPCVRTSGPTTPSSSHFQ